MSIYSCKNRRTKAIIERHDTQRIMQRGQYPTLVRLLFCRTHQIQGPTFTGHTHAMATEAQRHPWEWCEKCKEIYNSLNSPKSE